ncbi:hypothetical protein [Chitinimonas prasina]|nr:hypothetical protein [Chitinimonas prasina]
MSWPTAETAIRLDLGYATADAALIPQPSGTGGYLNVAHVLATNGPGTGPLTSNTPAGTLIWTKTPADVDSTCTGWAGMAVLDPSDIWVAARNGTTGIFWAKFNLISGAKTIIGGGVSSQSSHNGAFVRLVGNELHAYTDSKRFRYSTTTGALLAAESITLTSGYLLPGVPSYLPTNLRNALLRVPTDRRAVAMANVVDGSEYTNQVPLLVARNARTPIAANLDQPGAFGIYVRDHTAERSGRFIQYPGNRWLLVGLMSYQATAKNEISGSRLYTEANLDSWLERICNAYRT